MNSIRKLVVAIIGLLAVILTDLFNVPFDSGLQGTTVEIIIGILTALGVYKVRNEP